VKKLAIKTYRVADLLALRNPKNPRWMPESVAGALEASIESFGLVEPLILNQTTNQLVGGHQRLNALSQMGIETVPVVIVSLTPDQEITLNLALNKVRGEWDYEKLAPLLANISNDDLLATGFTEEETEAIVSSFSEGPTNEEEGGGAGASGRTRGQGNSQREGLSATVGVQLGMFSLNIPRDEYEAWVDNLIEESAQGSSPFALGTLVARRLGITAITQEVGDDE
jgi:ParB-like nuclease domain